MTHFELMEKRTLDEHLGAAKTCNARMEPPAVRPIRNVFSSVLARFSGGRIWFFRDGLHPQSRYGFQEPAHSRLVSLLSNRIESYQGRLEEISKLHSKLRSIPIKADPRDAAPRWRNGWLPVIDSAALCAMIAQYRPKRYVEIGSGNSTKFARWTISEFGTGTHLTSIDPSPRAEIDSLCDRVIRARFQDADLDSVRNLEKGDILFVDSSHRVYMNSDVTVIFLDLLPVLKPGVVVHFHDIWLPYDYPPHWKYWHFAEQYMLALYLMAGRSARILFPSMFVSQHPATREYSNRIVKSLDPDCQVLHGGSFWIEIIDQGERRA